MERPRRRRLLVARIGLATITYTVVASPIACNLPNPEPVVDEREAGAEGGGAAKPAAKP